MRQQWPTEGDQEGSDLSGDRPIHILQPSHQVRQDWVNSRVTQCPNTLQAGLVVFAARQRRAQFRNQVLDREIWVYKVQPFEVSVFLHLSSSPPSAVSRY